MEYAWLVLAIICAVVGLVGAIVPMLPGPPVSYVALWMIWLRDENSVSSTNLWIMGILMVVVSIIDYVAPIWMTKLGGGSKKSMHGATIGLIVGLFCGPWGLILGPFIGALIGELMTNCGFTKALKVASLSFIAFILTTGLKFFYGIAVVVMMVMVFWN